MAQLSGRQPRYKRILLKLSGEALMGTDDFGIDPKVLDRMALEIGQLVGIGVQVGLVIGGGNLFRGAALSANAQPGSAKHRLDAGNHHRGRHQNRHHNHHRAAHFAEVIHLLES